MAESNTTNAANKICAYEYTVKRGDSFYLISHRLGIPLRDLLAANTNINPARLMVGDVLCIPTEESDQHVPSGNGAVSAQEEPAAPSGTPTQAETVKPQPPSQPEAAPTPLPQTPAPDLTDDEDTEAVPNLDMPARMEGTGTGQRAGTCPEDRRIVVAAGETAADIQLAHQLNLHSLEMANPTVNFDNLEAGQELCIPQVNTPCPLPTHYTLGCGESLEAVAVKFNLPIGALLRANPCMAPADFEQGVCISLPK